ncbi:DNA replication ATP-dependent helicase/nuclease DNA2, partial [Kipferlia bialata]
LQPDGSVRAPLALRSDHCVVKIRAHTHRGLECTLYAAPVNDNGTLIPREGDEIGRLISHYQQLNPDLTECQMSIEGATLLDCPDMLSGYLLSVITLAEGGRPIPVLNPHALVNVSTLSGCVYCPMKNALDTYVCEPEGMNSLMDKGTILHGAIQEILAKRPEHTGAALAMYRQNILREVTARLDSMAYSLDLAGDTPHPKPDSALAMHKSLMKDMGNVVSLSASLLGTSSPIVAPVPVWHSPNTTTHPAVNGATIRSVHPSMGTSASSGMQPTVELVGCETPMVGLGCKGRLDVVLKDKERERESTRVVEIKTTLKDPVSMGYRAQALLYMSMIRSRRASSLGSRQRSAPYTTDTQSDNDDVVSELAGVRFVDMRKNNDSGPRPPQRPTRVPVKSMGEEEDLMDLRNRYILCHTTLHKGSKRVTEVVDLTEPTIDTPIPEPRAEPAPPTDIESLCSVIHCPKRQGQYCGCCPLHSNAPNGEGEGMCSNNLVSKWLDMINSEDAAISKGRDSVIFFHSRRGTVYTLDPASNTDWTSPVVQSVTGVTSIDEDDTIELTFRCESLPSVVYSDYVSISLLDRETLSPALPSLCTGRVTAVDSHSVTVSVSLSLWRGSLNLSRVSAEDVRRGCFAISNHADGTRSLVTLRSTLMSDTVLVPRALCVLGTVSRSNSGGYPPIPPVSPLATYERDYPRLAKCIPFNEGQAESLMALRDTPLVLTQGMPGCGKTSLAAAAAIVKLRDPTSGVLLIGATNAAVDNILLRMLDAVPLGPQRDRFTKGTIRVGSKHCVNPLLHSVLLENRIPEQTSTDTETILRQGILSRWRTMATTRVMAVTAHSCHSNDAVRFWAKRFSSRPVLVIIDEAAQLSAPWGALPLAWATSALVLGDPKQMSPLSMCESSNDGMGASLYASLDAIQSHSIARTVLSTQYRMSQPLLSLWNDTFREVYGKGMVSGLSSEPDLSPRNSQVPYPPDMPRLSPGLAGCLASPLPSLVRVSDDPVAVAVGLAVQCICSYKVTPDQVSVMCGFRRDAASVSAALESMAVRGVEVSTIDAFQGRSKRVAILLVRASPAGRYRYYVYKIML